MSSFSEYVSQFKQCMNEYILGHSSPMNYAQKLHDLHRRVSNSQVSEDQKFSLLEQIIGELMELESIFAKDNTPSR